MLFFIVSPYSANLNYQKTHDLIPSWVLGKATPQGIPPKKNAKTCGALSFSTATKSFKGSMTSKNPAQRSAPWALGVGWRFFLRICFFIDSEAGRYPKTRKKKHWKVGRAEFFLSCHFFGLDAQKWKKVHSL